VKVQVFGVREGFGINASYWWEYSLFVYMYVYGVRKGYLYKLGICC